LTSMRYVEMLVQCAPYLHWKSLDIMGVSDLQHFQNFCWGYVTNFNLVSYKTQFTFC
jgi:hypothetical protein